MNPNRDRAVEVRRRALIDQVAGLRQRATAGSVELHIDRRLCDTQAELSELEAGMLSRRRRLAAPVLGDGWPAELTGPVALHGPTASSTSAGHCP